MRAILLVAASLLAGLTQAVAVEPAPLDLPEYTPFLVHAPLGPGAAKGVVFSVGGYRSPLAFSTGGPQDSFIHRLPPYWLKTLSEQGWDVISARIPPAAAHGWELAPGIAATIAHRVASLRAQGYRRVIVEGGTLGSWSTLIAERDGGLAADALFINRPSAFGPRTLRNGVPNPAFPRAASEFPALLPSVRVPAIFTFMADDPWEPGGRAAMVNQALSGKPHIVIDQPPGFTGHYSDLLPVFDYAYGDCIRRFLATGASGPCMPPPLSNSDFRSIVALRQIGDPGARRITALTLLAGRSFALYTLRDVDNKKLTYDTAGSRTVLTSVGETHETVAFRDGLHCGGPDCTVLVQWAPGQILEFDPASGALRAWWIEVR